MYNYINGFRPYSNYMVKVMLVVMGALVGACIGLYVAAQFFPLSTQETIYIRNER